MPEWSIGMIVPLQDPTPFSPFEPTEWREALVEVSAAGFDGVELAITDPQLLETLAVAEVLEAEDLRLLSITTGQAAGLEGLSLSTPDDAVRRRAIRRIQAHMAFAETFGAVVIVGSLRGADGDVGLLADSLRECAAFSGEVTLALEPLNRYESRLLNRVDETLRFVDGLDAENVGILFDTFHANIEEASIGGSIARLGDRLAHVHLADSNRWVPGYGHIDFAGVRKALEGIDYRGGLVLEPLPRPDVDRLLGAGEALHRDWTSLRQGRGHVP